MPGDRQGGLRPSHGMVKHLFEQGAVHLISRLAIRGGQG
jgi:hypothetical protein